MSWKNKQAQRTAGSALKQLIGAQARPLSRSAWLSVLASLVLLGELSCIAISIETLLRTPGLGAILPYLAAFAGLALARILIESASAAIAARATEEVQEHARSELTNAIAKISPLDKNCPHAGEMATLVTTHVDALGPYLSRYRPARLRAAIIPAAVLLTTAYFSWVAALVLLSTGPLIPVFMALIGMQAQAASERQLKEIGTMNAGLLDRIKGLTTLRLFGAVPYATATLLHEGEDIRTRTMAVLRIAFLSSAVLELFAAVGVAFAAVYVGFNLLGIVSFGAYGELTLLGGLFVLMIAPEYFRPLRDFAAAYHDQAAARAASDEIEKVLGGQWLTLALRGSTVEACTSVSVDGVSVALDGATIFPAFSLDIKGGEQIALVGPSGSGKSVLLALLAGLITPSTGKILFNGKSDTTCRIAWLGQRPAFMQGSLAANLTMARPDADRAAFPAALELAQAGEVVARLDRGLDEILRENASNLSGGEAQRLAIARLALSQADFILADEPTEHLDAATADAVIDGLFKLAQGKTLIVATHDRRIVSRVARVIEVKKLTSGNKLEAAA
jgi:ATP-binding cassette subfamily C protein CydD